MTPLWIGLTALAYGIMAGSLSLLCVFALEVEGDRKELAPQRDSPEGGYAGTAAERLVPQPYAAALPQRRDRLLA